MIKDLVPVNVKAATNRIYDPSALPVSDYYSQRLKTPIVPSANWMFFNNSATWHKISGMLTPFEWFCTNPVYYAVVMIKARAYSNMRFRVRNVSTDKVEPITTNKVIPKAIYRLIRKPNPLMSTWEFLQQRKVFFECAGNSFTYFNRPVGFKPTVDNIAAMWNVWPAYMQIMYTGQYFEALSMADIVKKWKFEYGRYVREWQADEIMHRNLPNIDPNRGFILGGTPAEPLVKAITNIDMAYEARNVIMQNRGMRAVISSNKKDDSGSVMLLESEQKVIEKNLEDYGFLTGQKQFLFSPVPLLVDKLDQDVTKLGLFEEIVTDGMTLCIAHGVPEVLLRLALEGATYENQAMGMRRLYQDTIIPEAEDDMIGFNNYLGLEETDWRLEGSFDHIAALQESEKEKSSANKDKSTYLEKLFFAGGLTVNQWLKELDLEPYEGGDIRITDMTPEQIQLLMGKVKPQGDGEQGQEGQAEQGGNSGSGKGKK